jgi:hypothetical protein
MRRVTFYLDDDEYRQLKIVLAIHGMSASEWLRHEIKNYVDQVMPGGDVRNIRNITPPHRETPKPPSFDPDVDLQ